MIDNDSWSWWSMVHSSCSKYFLANIGDGIRVENNPAPYGWHIFHYCWTLSSSITTINHRTNPLNNWARIQRRSRPQTPRSARHHHRYLSAKKWFTRVGHDHGSVNGHHAMDRHGYYGEPFMTQMLCVWHIYQHLSTEWPNSIANEVSIA